MEFLALSMTLVFCDDRFMVCVCFSFIKLRIILGFPANFASVSTTMPHFIPAAVLELDMGSG